MVGSLRTIILNYAGPLDKKIIWENVNFKRSSLKQVYEIIISLYIFISNTLYWIMLMIIILII